MTSFQERFKGKTSTISKEGVIPNLDKPPISKGYIQKDQQQLDRHQISLNTNGNNPYSINSNNFTGTPGGNYSNPSAYSAMSNPYTIQGTYTTASSKSSQAKGYENGVNEKTGLNKQQLSNSNFSTRSEQSNTSKVSINQKMTQQQQQSLNDPYFIANPFSLDMVSVNSTIGNGYQQQQLGKGGTHPQQQHNSSKSIGQSGKDAAKFASNQKEQSARNSSSTQNIKASQNTVSSYNGLQSNITSENSLAPSIFKNQSNGSNSKISSYTLENNTKQGQFTAGQQQNKTSITSTSNPYNNYNPYTLDAIENNTVKYQYIFPFLSFFTLFFYDKKYFKKYYLLLSPTSSIYFA